MKYLITGGAGFIGSHLIELLIKKKIKVVCVDDLSSGNLSNLSSVVKKIEFYKERIEIVERLTDHDAIIATGSNNSSRYFEHYFGNYPNIIRKNFYLNFLINLSIYKNRSKRSVSAFL